MCEQAANPPTPEHRCPECGGDVRVTSARPRGKPIFSGLLALIVLLALLIYLSPWVQMKLGDQFAVRDAIPTKNDPQFAELTMTITNEMLLDARAGNAESRDEILDQLMHQINEYGDPGDDLFYRFAFCDPKVTVFDSVAYGCAGTVWNRMRIHHETVSAEGTASPYERYPSTMASNLNRTRWWPHQRTRVLDAGSTMLTERFNLIGLCSTIAVAIGVLWALSWIRRRVGTRRRMRPSLWLLAFFLTTLGLVLWSVLRPQSHPYRAMQETPRATTPWKSAGALQQLSKTREGRDELFSMLIEAAPDTRASLLIGAQWKRGFTPRWRSWRWGLGSEFMLLTLGIDNFYSAPTATQSNLVPVPPYIVQTLPTLDPFNLKQVRLRFVSRSNLWTISFSPGGWILIGVGGMLLWQLFRFLGHLPRIHAQHRRVKRHQCVFCGYPLSQAAQDARSSALGS